MAIKFLSGLNITDVTAGSILKLDSNGNVVAATAGTDYATSSLWSSPNSGTVYTNDKVGIGYDNAGAKLHVYEYQTTTPKILIEDGNTGDASMQFKISTQQYTVGIDNSDADKFKISAGSSFTTSDFIFTSGGNLGLGRTPSTRLDLNGTIRARGGTNNAKNIDVYVNDSWGYLTTTAAKIYMNANLRVDTGYIGSYNEDLKLTTGDTTRITVSNTNGNVGIGTTSPSYKLHVDGTIGTKPLDYRYIVSTNQIDTYTYSTKSLNMPLNGYLWHDLLAFDYNYTRTQEVSTDGSTWTSTTLQKELFSQRQDQSVTVMSSTQKGVRWTITGVAWSIADYLNLAFTYQQNDISKTVLIESSSDGSTWTTRHSSTATSGIATKTCYISGYSGDNYLRITIKKATDSTNPVRMSSVKLMTARAGDQGQGMEYQYPYVWDKDRNISIGSNSTNTNYKLLVTGNSKVTGVLDVGGSELNLVSGAQIDWANGDARIIEGAVSNYSLSFQTYTGSSLTTKMFISGGGNIGIGTTQPLQTFDVSGVAYFRGGTAANFGSGDTPADTALIIDEGDFIYTRDSNNLRKLIGKTSSDIIEIGQTGTSLIDGIRFKPGTAGGYVSVYDNNSEEARFTGGKLGLGTTSPNHKLDIYSDTNMPLRIHRPNSALDTTEPVGIGFSHRGDANNSTTDTRAGIFSSYNGDLFLSVDSGGRVDDNPIADAAVFIEGSNSNVGIGTTSPSEKLHVVGNAIIDGGNGDATLTIKADADNSGEDDNPNILFSQDGGNVTSSVGFVGTAGQIYTSSLGNAFYINTNAAGVPIQFSTNGSAKMTIEDGGNIGMGISNPDVLLHLYRGTSTGSSTTGTTLMKIENYVGSDLQQQKSFVDFIFRDDNNNETPQVRIGAEVGENGNADSQAKEGSGAFVVYTNDADTDSGNAGTSLAERFRVDYSGKVGIGTASPNYKLDVNGTLRTSTLYSPTVRVSGTADHLTLRSDIQVGQGDEDAIIEFKHGTNSLGKFDQDGYIYAAGFKTSTASTGLLKADGTVDTTTLGTMASESASDYKDSDTVESYVATELTSYTPTSSFGSNAFTSYTDHSTQGYLTALPSHDHDDRYYTETELNGFFKSITHQGNYISTADWSLDGSGSVPNGWSSEGYPFSPTGSFNKNGGTSENTRILQELPNGAYGVVWRTPSNDASSDADGGWDMDIYNVHHSKAYRSIVMFQVTDDSVSGTFYHGCHGSHTLNLDGTANTNPYFHTQGFANLVQGRWYVSVGYIQPYQYPSGTNSTRSGIYDCYTGKKVVAGQDYMMKSGSTAQRHRTYQYYSTDTNSSINWWNPRFEEVNGNEPSIAELIQKVSLDGELGLNFHSKFPAGALDSLTEATDATNDKILLWDESADVWKQMTLEDLQDSIDNNTTYSAATTSADGLMSSTDKTKLDGIATGAEVNVQSDWNATTGDAFIQNKPTLFDGAYSSLTGVPSSFTPSSHSHSDATTSASGFMSSTDKTKLDGVATGADVTPTWVPSTDPSYITGLNFNDLGSKTSGTGDYKTTGKFRSSDNIVSGEGSGGVALTINDGKGNANVTFNHEDGTPEQNGNAARIEVNTDSTTNAAMHFELKANVSANTSVDLTNAMSLYETYMEIPYQLRHTGDSNTYLQFDNDRIRLIANNTTKFDSNNTYLVSGNDIAVQRVTARDTSPESDRTYNLGTDSMRWAVVFCETLDSAGQHESNLQDEEQPISQYATGTVLSWKDGKNRPCTQFADHMRMGIAVEGQESPLVQGAEPVLVTGPVEEGDYLLTSRKTGHAEAMPRHLVIQQQLMDCVIGKALESGDGESHLVKTWINI